MRVRRGKQLGGKPPRSGGRWTWERKRGRAPDRGRSTELLAVLAIGLFVVGGVAGFAWAMDREVRGGILRQQAEAAQRPDWVSLQALPAHVPRAFLLVVDPDFSEGGALRRGENGTTLARQLVRQVHALPGTLPGEARELVMGPVLEKRATKGALLELFLNRVYLGQDQGFPVYGIYHASREYFGKEAQELTLSETATLAGLLLVPRIADPHEHIGALGPRRNEVLRAMLQAELITPQEYEQAIRERLGFQPGIRDFPMTRPRSWPAEVPIIRIPEELRPRPDSLEAG